MTTRTISAYLLSLTLPPLGLDDPTKPQPDPKPDPPPLSISSIKSAEPLPSPTAPVAGLPAPYETFDDVDD